MVRTCGCVATASAQNHTALQIVDDTIDSEGEVIRTAQSWTGTSGSGKQKKLGRKAERFES